MLLHEDTADALLWVLTKIAVVDVPPPIRRLLSRGGGLGTAEGRGRSSAGHHPTGGQATG
eukprot:668091-Prorocentrum_lima.AAC.1